MTGRRLRTWKRIAFPAVLFFAAAVFLAGRALAVRVSLQQEKNAPCLLTASVDDPSDIAAIPGLPGVSACSEVQTVDATIRAGVWEGEFSVCGVNADMINGRLITGSLFPEKTAMPYLVLNEAALCAFSRTDAPSDAAPAAADLAGMTVLLDDTYAKISGIVADGLTVPCVYMSLDAARTFLVSHGTQPAADTVRIRLYAAGSAGTVTEALDGLGCMVTDTDADTASWGPEETRIRLMLLAAGIAAAAAAATLHAAIRLEGYRFGEKFSAKENLLRILIIAVCSLTAGGLALLLRIAWEQ